MLHVSRSELGRAPVGGPNFLAAPHAGEPLTDRPLRTRPWRIRMRQGPLDAWLWFPQMAALLTVRARPPRRPSHVCSEHRPRLLSRSEKPGFRIDSPPLLLAAHYLPPPLPAC